jgi:hypothetical protein
VENSRIFSIWWWKLTTDLAGENLFSLKSVSNLQNVIAPSIVCVVNQFGDAVSFCVGTGITTDWMIGVRFPAWAGILLFRLRVQTSCGPHQLPRAMSVGVKQLGLGARQSPSSAEVNAWI